MQENMEKTEGDGGQDSLYQEQVEDGGPLRAKGSIK